LAYLEEYVLANAGVFAQAGVPAIMLQDQTREAGPAAPVTVAVVSALGRLVRATYPALHLGIIVQAHDVVAPLAIAHACGASFVRLKVFVGASMTMEGPKTGLGVAAQAARHALGRTDIAILADVFDRTSLPMVDIAPTQGARWAEALGADGLILTGDSFADSLTRITNARAAGVRRPILIGGSVTDANVAEALAVADGAIVSTSLMREGAGPSDVLRWDAEKTQRFMDRVRAMEGRHG
jgi:predicted TIM-barrel enzyme